MMRNSFNADSKLRADNQEVRAIRKNPIIAGKFGVRSIDMEIIEMMTLLMMLKMKLDHGASNMLAIIMGMVKANKERPAETCSGVSLNENMRVNNPRNITAAIFSDQRELIM